MAVTYYCVIGDIQAKLGRTYSASTKPTSTQVTAFITDTFAEINGVLDARGYSVPIPTTATTATTILKNINVLGAAALAEDAGQSVSMAGSISAQAESLRAQYAEKIDLLGRGRITLVDATETDYTPAQGDEQTPVGQFNVDDDDEERDPVFTRTMEF